MDADTFHLTAERTFNALPVRFLKAMENVVVVTDEFADAAVLAEMGIDSPWGLLGLYEGHPITEREAVDSGTLPDLIHLYRQPILAEARNTGMTPEACMRDTLIHEIGHYFGFSDAQMALFERQACANNGD